MPHLKAAGIGFALAGNDAQKARLAGAVEAHDHDPLPALGLLLLGYPLHPAGKPEKLRVDHFPRITVPVLFVSGTRDSLAGADELRAHARAIRGKVSFHWIETADHGFKPLKASGTSTAEALATAAVAAVDWVTHLT